MTYKIHPTCRKFSLVVSFMLVCLISQAQNSLTGVDQLLSPFQKKSVPKMAVLVYKDGKPEYQKEMGEEYTVKSREAIGSSSKWLTAALVMTFVDEGKLSLDDKVSTYLPIFETYGKSYITIRQCLSHQTGIADNQKAVAKLLEKRKFESLEEEVNAFVKKEIGANPGTTFFYGDIGPNIAGRVLEVIAKKRFDVLAKQRLFTPLNMKNSSFTPEDHSANPSGGAISSAGDYMNFLSMLLAKGTFMGKRILSEASIEQMATIQNGQSVKKYSPKGTETYSYGLGAWIPETTGAGNGKVIACPSFNGISALVDNCRNYACLVFTTDISAEQSAQLQTQIKALADAQFAPACN